MNKEIYNDGINWISYHETPNGRLLISDYPQSELQGGGPKRTREIELEDEKKEALVDHLETIQKYSKEVYEHWKEMRLKIRIPFDYLEAVSEGSETNEILNQARRNYGWSFTPEKWGEEIESSFWRLLKILEK